MTGPKDRHFYRCFSESSAGGLVSGKGNQARKLSKDELHSEFRNHRNRYSEVPTALISVTSSFIEVLSRAFDMLATGDDPEEIWVVFICVPHEDKNVYHHAEQLAEATNTKDPGRFKNEYIFEWEISERYIAHAVSMQTLLNRGLNPDYFSRSIDGERRPLSAPLLKQKIGDEIIDALGYETGINLGSIERVFGASASVCSVALQMLSDCTSYIDQEHQYAFICGKDRIIGVDFGKFVSICRGIKCGLTR